jgi:hypothetical protein
MNPCAIATAIGIVAAIGLYGEANARPAAARAPASLKTNPQPANPVALGLTRSHAFGPRAHIRRSTMWRRGYPYPGAGVVLCSVDGTCYDSGAPTFDIPFDQTVAAPPVVTPTVRPDCRMESQTRVVAAEAGGERRVTIRQCVAPVHRPSSREGRANDEPGLDLAASDLAIGPGPLGIPVSPRECGEQAWSVASEGGGKRMVTIRRC